MAAGVAVALLFTLGRQRIAIELFPLTSSPLVEDGDGHMTMSLAFLRWRRCVGARRRLPPFYTYVRLAPCEPRVHIFLIRRERFKSEQP